MNGQRHNRGIPGGKQITFSTHTQKNTIKSVGRGVIKKRDVGVDRVEICARNQLGFKKKLITNIEKERVHMAWFQRSMGQHKKKVGETF